MTVEEMAELSEEEMFEHAYFVAVYRIAEQQLGMNKTQFARALWPDARHHGRNFSALEGGTKTGKPRTIKLSEAYRMAQIIGMDIGELCKIVKIELESGRIQRLLYPVPPEE